MLAQRDETRRTSAGEDEKEILMDLTGSIADATAPLSTTLTGSLNGGALAGEPTGSSFIDTALTIAAGLPNYLLGLVARTGADLGSTMGTP